MNPKQMTQSGLQKTLRPIVTPAVRAAIEKSTLNHPTQSISSQNPLVQPPTNCSATHQPYAPTPINHLRTSK
jgi:hypothetical protein